MIPMDFECKERSQRLSGVFSLHVFTIFRHGGVVNGGRVFASSLSSLSLKESGSFFSGHRSFVYSFILLSVLLHLYSLPPPPSPSLFCSLLAGVASCKPTLSRWLSIVQIRPGVVCLCLCSVMQRAGAWRAAKTRPTETAAASSKELSCCRRRRRCRHCVVYSMLHV